MNNVTISNEKGLTGIISSSDCSSRVAMFKSSEQFQSNSTALDVPGSNFLIIKGANADYDGSIFDSIGIHPNNDVVLDEAITTALCFSRKSVKLVTALGEAKRLRARGYWKDTYRNRRIKQNLIKEIAILNIIGELVTYITPMVQEATKNRGQYNHMKRVLNYDTFALEFITSGSGFLVGFSTYDGDELTGDVDGIPLWKYKSIIGGYSFTKSMGNISGPMHRVAEAIYNRTNNQFKIDDTLMPPETIIVTK